MNKEEYLRLLKRLPKASTLERKGILDKISENTITLQDTMNLEEALEEIYTTIRSLDSIEPILKKINEIILSKRFINSPTITIESTTSNRFGTSRAVRGRKTNEGSNRLSLLIIDGSAFLPPRTVINLNLTPIPSGVPVPKDRIVDSSINYNTFNFADFKSYLPEIQNNYILVPLIYRKQALMVEGYFKTVYYLKDWSVHTKDNITFLYNSLFAMSGKPIYSIVSAFQMVDNKIIQLKYDMYLKGGQ